MLLPDLTRLLKRNLDQTRCSAAHALTDPRLRSRLAAVAVWAARCGLRLTATRTEPVPDEGNMDHFYSTPLTERAIVLHRVGEQEPFGALALISANLHDDMQIGRVCLCHPIWVDSEDGPTEAQPTALCLLLVRPPSRDDGRPIPQLELPEGHAEVERQVVAGFAGVPADEVVIGGGATC